MLFSKVSKVSFWLSWIVLVFSFQFVIAQGAIAREGKRQLVIPAKSTLHSPTELTKRGSAVSLKGEVWVKGSLLVVWTGTQNQPMSRIEVTLIPDQVSDLPQFKTHSFKSVFIENGAKDLQAVLGEKMATRLSRKQVRSAQVQGRFLIKNFQMGITCDSGWASASLRQTDVVINTVVENPRDRKINGC